MGNAESSEWEWGSQAGPSTSYEHLVGRQVGRFTLNDLLGRGGFGCVFSAWDPEVKRRVAVKLLTRPAPRAAERFLREARSLGRLRHPGIATVYESGQLAGTPYLVMELIEGPSLAEHCEPDALLPVDDVAAVGRDVARALEYAHGRGIVHRDVKPQNILLGPEGPVLVDFGLAFLQDHAGVDRLSQEGASVGTPAYMAPEQSLGEQPDERTDVYGLGATLYHALAGRLPIEGSGGEFLARLHRATPDPPSSGEGRVPRALDAICLRCLAKDRLDRYDSAADLADDLERYLGGRVSVGPSRARRLGAATVLLSLGAAGAVGVAHLRRAAEPPVPPTAPIPPAAVKTAPTKAEARAALAAAHEHILRGRFPEAQEAAGRALKAAGVLGRRARYLYGIARSHSQEDNEVLERLARDDPDGVYGLMARAFLLEEPEEARRVARRILEREPGQPDGWEYLGYAELQLGNNEEAIRAFRELERREPSSPYAQIGLASAYARTNAMGKALVAAREAIRYFEGRPTPGVILLHGKIQMSLKTYTEARASFDRAHQMRPHKAAPLVWRGMSWHEQREHDRAARDWRRARAIDAPGFEAILAEFPERLREVIRSAAAAR